MANLDDRHPAAQAGASASEGASLVFSAAPIPRYLQIADLMRGRIARGLWRKGDKVPSLEALVAEFGVARVTVRQAMEMLAREGLVSPQQGRGTFVTARPAGDQWLKVQTSLDALAASYRDDRPTLLAIEEGIAHAPLVASDGTPAERYVYMRRVHAKDGQPYCVIDIYLDERVFNRSPKRFRRETVIPILCEMGDGVVARARQVLTIGQADTEVSRLLRVPVNSPVARVRRVFTDPAGRVVYLGDVAYRGDFVHLEMSLKG